MATAGVGPEANAAPAAPAARPHVLIAFSGLLLAMLLAALDSTIVATALPTIVTELGGLTHLAWVVTAYLLAQTVATPIYGKLGDLYGRKKVLQSAVVIFLIGSALCGLSRSMVALIAFRALQGLGGGGLTVTTQAVVGDLVPPRDRGRYQGIFGAAFGLASIAGPLLGGFFTTHLTWRWIFYINLPLGIAALIVLGATLPSQQLRREHAVDYAGASFLAVALAAITLFTDLGGAAYAWTSSVVLGLIALSALALVLFAVAERRAREPVLPLRLFAHRAFAVTSAVGLIVGFALFGSVTYFPLYLQVVRHVSPTASGLEMLPMMAGMLTTSILSGQLISRSGRYKLFPILGTAVMTIGLFLLARLTATSSAATASADLLVLGVGLGMVMQVLVIVVQNTVEYRDLGVATSGATLFRLVGGSLGTAALGAVFSGRLEANRATMGYLPAFTASLDTVFLVAAVVCAVGFVLTWWVPEHPLRATVAASASDAGAESAGAFARPANDATTEAQFMAALASIADRDVRRQHIQRIVQRAGVPLSPLAAWMLVQIEHGARTVRRLISCARKHQISSLRVTTELSQLEHAGLVHWERAALEPTDLGCQVLNRLVEARREHLLQLASEWNPHGDRTLTEFLTDVVKDAVPDVRRTA